MEVVVVGVGGGGSVSSPILVVPREMTKHRRFFGDTFLHETLRDDTRLIRDDIRTQKVSYT